MENYRVYKYGVFRVEGDIQPENYMPVAIFHKSDGAYQYASFLNIHYGYGGYVYDTKDLDENNQLIMNLETEYKIKSKLL